MASQSLSSSTASSVPSVLEGSNYDDNDSRSDGKSNVNYDEEQFELESEDEPVGAPLTGSLNSSDSEKYGSNKFEDDPEDTVEITTFEAVERVERDCYNENDYEEESFEREEEPINEQEDGVALEVNEKQPDILLNRAEKLQVEEEVSPQLGIWCSKKIHELRSASSKPESSQPKAKRVSDKIPAAVVENLIHRASSARQYQCPHRTHHPYGNSWLRSRHKLKAPDSLIQRAQTQLWLAKASVNSNTKASAPATLFTSTRSVAPTFCSVKRDNLLGQLATMQISEATKRWATSDSGGLSLVTFDFVQYMATKQREVCAANAVPEEPGGKILHRLTMTTRLQLEDSVALRGQAATLLGHLST